MKKLVIIAVTAATLGVTAQASWFDNGEKDRRIQIEQQLERQQKATGDWQLATFTLGIFSILTLIGGTAIGSRSKQAAKKEDKHEPEN